MFLNILNLESLVPLREIYLVARDIFSCEGLFAQEKKIEKKKICTGMSISISKNTNVLRLNNNFFKYSVFKYFFGYLVVPSFYRRKEGAQPRDGFLKF